MLRDLTTDQRRLADFMSDLSEQAYCAGWMDGLEYALWEALVGTRREYGRLDLSDTQRMRLRELSEACGGWIVFDDDNEETWLPRVEWEERFSAQRKTRDPAIE